MNKLIILSGPSGVGKTSIMRVLMDNEVISFTTRSPRVGEVHGKDYVFISDDEFNKLRDNNGLAEYTDYYGTAKYGITMEELTTKLAYGHAFVVVDVIGMEQLKKLYAEYITIFIRTDPQEAERRMIKRGDSKERIRQRMKTFGEELENYYLYDYILENTGRLGDSIEGMGVILHEEGVI